MNKGFTIIELILTVAIVGIFAVSALPSFTDVTTSAEISSRDAVASSIQTGVQLQRANDMVSNGPPGVYPAALDAVPVSTPCAPANPCFGGVLYSPIGDYKNGRGWSKINNTSYSFNDGSTAYTYNYDSAAGTFTLQ
ncbi:MAG: type II secretion system protein [Deltaproteobacteria bacterium]|nr:type II secretion system protein [Deltaproteobacteria bacterium]